MLTHVFTITSIEYASQISTPLICKYSQVCGLVHQGKAGAAAAMNGQGTRRGDGDRIRVFYEATFNAPFCLSDVSYST